MKDSKHFQQTGPPSLSIAQKHGNPVVSFNRKPDLAGRALTYYSVHYWETLSQPASDSQLKTRMATSSLRACQPVSGQAAQSLPVSLPFQTSLVVPGLGAFALNGFVQ